MKKIGKVIILLGLSLVVLGACGSKNKDDKPINSSEEQAVVTDKTLVFTGKLAENVTITDDGASFKVVDVVASEDPEKAVLAFESDGVVLNASKDQLPANFKDADYSAGTEIKVILEALPVTTRSIPPQVPGASIISIEKP